MPSFNRVVLIGRLTRDPELRHTASGLAVATFSLAVDRRFKSQSGEKQTDFFRCKAWRQTAEFVNSYVTKGRLVAVEGRIETSEVVGQDGVKKYFTDIVCDQVETLDSSRDQGGAQGGRADEGNGYFPDDDINAGPAQSRGAAPQGGVRNAGAPGGGQSAPSGNRPAQPPQAAYPADDFDDSDPFADE